ncbi:TPA: hypothetical protein JBD88_13555 [Legionella pneumophila subsp. pneumophila]|uniref:hypothetical protein n=2 Tax=Legionella pneumophila TaxID=446 RepID=UPI0007706DCE|nr:hypothetical protein [Legionella pneumophila]HAT9694997.1 hypothetical protein [Legionella pneumophila subsp. pneumophila]CZG86463.1 Uncharacterised protein [Legionella pneumophila]HAT1804220.1 hypothetical protein [Legionella pneumophila]HAT9829323.1 hypothetical protein [Legionella pneumophila subsp. pneumophila]HAT9909849.1 hypothetical protein [Legionella pneumophila subsp. pneumophila]
MVNITGGNINKKIYDEYLFYYQSRLPKDAHRHAPVLANVSVFLSNPSLITQALAVLEQEVKFLWDFENSTRTADKQLKLNQSIQFCRFMNLLWPVPNEELISNKTNNLLSKVLLYREQKHGFNFDENLSQRPVPTFVGFVDKKEADKVLEKNQLWSEENKLSPLFFHGKETHRLQLNLIMIAVELGLLDIGGVSVVELKNILAKVKTQNDLPLWDSVIDTVAVGDNAKMNLRHPLILRKTPAIITDNMEHNSQYIYGMDPFYFHSYLMSIARKDYPYLAQCVTEKFCKSAFKLNQIENALGYKYGNDELRALGTNERDIMSTLERLAKAYNTNIHVITSEHILQYQQAKKEGKAFNEVTNSKKLEIRAGTIKSNGFTFKDTVGVVLFKKPYQGWQEYKKHKNSHSIMEASEKKRGI